MFLNRMNLSEITFFLLTCWLVSPSQADPIKNLSYTKSLFPFEAIAVRAKTSGAEKNLPQKSKILFRFYNELHRGEDYFYALGSRESGLDVLPFGNEFEEKKYNLAYRTDGVEIETRGDVFDKDPNYHSNEFNIAIYNVQHGKRELIKEYTLEIDPSPDPAIQAEIAKWYNEIAKWYKLKEVRRPFWSEEERQFMNEFLPSWQKKLHPLAGNFEIYYTISHPIDPKKILVLAGPSISNTVSQPNLSYLFTEVYEVDREAGLVKMLKLEKAEHNGIGNYSDYNFEFEGSDATVYHGCLTHRTEHNNRGLTDSWNFIFNQSSLGKPVLYSLDLQNQSGFEKLYSLLQNKTGHPFHHDDKHHSFFAFDEILSPFTSAEGEGICNIELKKLK